MFHLVEQYERNGVASVKMQGISFAQRIKTAITKWKNS